jgi:propanediol dehydratase small subunit
MSKEDISRLVESLARQKSGVEIPPQMLDQAVKRILDILQDQQGTGSSKGDTLSARDYPLSMKRKDLVHSAGGLTLDDITLAKVAAGEIKFEDIKIKPETLDFQAQIAESVDRPALAANLRRAAEMTRIPDARVLEIYNSLRPYRCTKKEMLDIADELESRYQAAVCAAFVREAADVYEKNNRLKK